MEPEIKAKDANKKHYFSSIENQEVNTTMNDAVTSNVSAFLWKKGQSEKDLEEFEIVSFDEQSKILSLKLKSGFLSKLTGSSLIDQEVFFKITLSKHQFFSYSNLEFDKGQGLYSMQINNDFYKSQQRTNYRIMASSHVKVQLKIEDTVFDCLDLSAGGSSFMIQDSEKEHFAKGKEFKDIMLRFNKEKIKISNLKIMGLWEQLDTEEKPTGEIKLGVAFVDLPKEMEELLFKEINGEARAEEIRKNLKSKKSPTQTT